ncbi:hypothetical protein [Erwinia aphidicola]|uniref:hypothetical protein n=1 Tax=Erwinia aphidicola TaxID=68334 RepID=UPI0020A20990|nr:hypothetical protein [Erwinia aphidicola]MCP2230638.1 hypothetical protein [Erwinia aphidicola]
MILNVFYSHFSLRKSHACSYRELESFFKELSDFQKLFPYKDIEHSIATDFLKYRYYGTSIEQQIENFCFQDKQVMAAFKSRFFQEWFPQALFNKTTNELLESSKDDIDTLVDKCYIGYIPHLEHIEKANNVHTKEDIDNRFDFLLSKYPMDSNSWYLRAKSRFENLIFHDKCINTIDNCEENICDFSKSLTKCLIALNKCSPTQHRNVSTNLKEIGAIAGFKCTEEGKSDPKFKYSFSYSSDNSSSQINCVYHLKPSKHNNSGDSKHYHLRIYFGFYAIKENSYNIAVASIGPHL